ncbi:MAG TPA: cytochrome c oxidase subunit 4 [Frankiaceae bacterium]|nr:cytochrome c oxidase subunit 4 [Frankiaceae bacterium]
MRTASRVFFWLGLFGLIAVVTYAAASRFGFENIGGITTLTLFFVACMFLAKFLGTQGGFELDGLNVPGTGHDEHEEIHLPPPSWMPAAYSVAALVLVLGLVMSPPMVVAGIALIVLTTIGWGIESVKEYRREIAHAKPGHGPHPAAVDLAQQVLAFRRLHGGAEAVVQHVGRGRAQVVLVGGDGGFGMLHADDLAVAREAATLAASEHHQSWPTGLRDRVRTGEEHWRAMGGESLFGGAEGHDAPRDGTTQVAARVFGWLGVFGVIAAVTFALASRFSFDNVGGIVTLVAFSAACYYLYLGLKNAKARPEDAVYADDSFVTIETDRPDPPVDLETLHLPGPSWWPAAFSVAAGSIVLGLVMSTPLLLVGLGLLVICCIGWGVESVHEYRQSIAGHHGGAADALHQHPNPLAH